MSHTGFQGEKFNDVLFMSRNTAKVILIIIDNLVLGNILMK